jgi:hypothetical protein
LHKLTFANIVADFSERDAWIGIIDAILADDSKNLPSSDIQLKDFRSAKSRLCGSFA